MWYKLLLIIGIGLNILAQLLLKHGMRGLDILFLQSSLTSKARLMLLNPFLWGALFSLGAGFFLYAIVLSKINLNTAYPVASVLTVVVIYLFSLFYFNESLTVANLAGILLSITGIVLLLK